MNFQVIVLVILNLLLAFHAWRRERYWERRVLRLTEKYHTELLQGQRLRQGHHFFAAEFIKTGQFVFLDTEGNLALATTEGQLRNTIGICRFDVQRGDYAYIDPTGF